MNEIIDDDFVLTKENFASVQMPNKDGFVVDNRPDTNNTRCMENCKNESDFNIRLGPECSLNKVTESDSLEEPNQGGLVEAKNTYEEVCQVCHTSGIANAPKLGVSEDWVSRLEKGKDSIYHNALNGINGMPAKGGRGDLSDETIKQAVDYMLSTIE